MLSAAPAESVTGHAENKHLGAGRVTRCETSKAACSVTCLTALRQDRALHSLCRAAVSAALGGGASPFCCPGPPPAAGAAAPRPPAGPGQPPAGGPGPAPPRSASGAGFGAGFGAAPPGAGRHERGRALRRRWGRLWVQVGAGTGPRGARGWGLRGWAGSALGAPAQVFGCCCADSLRAPQVSLPSPPLPSCPLSLGIPPWLCLAGFRPCRPPGARQAPVCAGASLLVRELSLISAPRLLNAALNAIGPVWQGFIGP